MITLGKFTPNKHGIDYVVGDLHGDYDNLIYQLNNTLKFNYETDRLFCVGDLIDRGDFSIKCLNLLNEKWFFSCLGNHELMLLNAYKNNDYKFTENWFLLLNNEERENIYNLITNKMYLSMEIYNKNYNKIGVIHAEYNGNSWYSLINELNKLNQNNDEILVNNNIVFNDLFWGRKRFKSNDIRIINDVDKVVVGHTVIQNVSRNIDGFIYKNDVPFYLGNTLFLDTGGVYKNQALLNLNLFKLKMNNIKKNKKTLSNEDIQNIEKIQQKIFSLEKKIENNTFNLSFYNITNDVIIKGEK